MNGNDSAWTSVKGRSQVKQNSQKIKTTTNGHQGTLNSNNFLPTASKTTAIDREIKSLAKCEANIKNTRWHFEEELKKSQDRLKRAFNEMRERLNQRERDLVTELESCKVEGLDLLNNREHTEQQLKIETARVAAITNPKDLEDLRQKIRKFLNEKRLEDELGKSLRFQYEPDKLIDCILHFGEVQPIYGRPSDVTKNPSLTSLISAEESSIDSSCISAGKHEKPVVNQVNIGGLVIKSDCMDPAQLADLTRQLQENLRLQGITEDILPEVTGSSGANTVPHRRPNTQSSRGSSHRNNQTGKNQQQQRKQHQTPKLA
uniref:Uncharacterized protein n=1 Tax=Romanomermis culicivorax TaxID=13658 RepID=A0A915JWC9_ROMCU